MNPLQILRDGIRVTTENILPKGWREATRVSNLRHVRRVGWFNTHWLRACINPRDCPMSRAGSKCISSVCIGRYPEEADLFEYIK